MSAAPALDRVLDHLRLRRAPGRPTQVHLSVTDRCFLPCLHCDIWKNKAEDLPTAFWLDAIDRLGAWCAPAGLNLVGGEPLLRKDLEQLMTRAVRRGFEVSFNTNGWLMTAARAAAIAEAGVSVAYVSLDGATAATVDHSRGRVGSFEKALAAVDLLRAQGQPRVVLASVLHAGNAAEVPALLQLVRDNDLQLVVQPLYQNFGPAPYDPTWWQRSPFFPRDEAARARLEAALDRLTVERLRGGPVLNAAAQLQAMKQHFRAPDQDNGQSCRAGHSDLSVDPQGRLRLCYFLEPIGHLHEVLPLHAQWDRPEALRRRWEVSRCDRHCNLLNCNFARDDSA
ncbi:MAG: radical SAM protein [Deltaproteobacteria bacterium]|nr:radical SAM protein [Deltaproteobacteria bacterium]